MAAFNYNLFKMSASAYNTFKMAAFEKDILYFPLQTTSSFPLFSKEWHVVGNGSPIRYFKNQDFTVSFVAFNFPENKETKKIIGLNSPCFLDSDNFRNATNSRLSEEASFIFMGFNSSTSCTWHSLCYSIETPKKNPI